MSKSGDSAPGPQRGAEDDHDLLTYGEVGVRLHEAIEAQEGLVTQLAKRGDSAQVAEARARLEALREAKERNRRQPINDKNFEQFFGYTGTPQGGSSITSSNRIGSQERSEK
jgi:hypothetical protein